MGGWWPCLLLLCLQGEGDGIAAAAPVSRPVQEEEVVIELLIGRLARRTVLALSSDGLLLLPAREFFDLIELSVSIDSLGRLAGVREPERVPIAVDPGPLTASVGEETIRLAAPEVAWQRGTLYLATRVLEKLLDIQIEIDWVELLVGVTNPERLPVARRIARAEARRAREEAAEGIAGRQFGVERPGWDGAVLDWSVFLPSARSLDAAIYRFGLGLNVLGGSLEAEYEAAARGTGGKERLSWLGVWPDQIWLRQVGVGDVLGSGPRPSSLRGLLLTNSPFVRPAAFGREVLAGRLAPGWEVELYRNGDLLDYAETDGRGLYRFDAPVEYGPNPLEFRAYGPFGEVQVFYRALRVEPDRLPDGTFEYGLSGGECLGRPCASAGNLDLRYGLSRLWTVRGGLDAFWRDTLPDLLQPYASLSGTVARAWVVRAEALRDGFAGTDVFYEPTPDLRVGVGGAVYDSEVESPILTPAGWRSEVHAFAFWRPMPARRAFFLEGGGRWLRTQTADQATLRLGATTQLGSSRLSGGVRHERAETGGTVVSTTFGHVGASATLSLQGTPILDRLFLTGFVEGSAEFGFERLEVSAARHLGIGWRIEGRSAWQRGSSEPLLALGLAAEFPAMRSFSHVTRPPGGDLSGTNVTEGSVIWNSPARRLEVAPVRSLRRGGVGGVVFLDANGNGRYDAGDQPLPNVVLQVGPHSVRTDDRGVFAAWDLVPFGTEWIAVDSFSLANPLWVPSFGRATIVIAPNGYRRVEIPVLPGAEVVGRVTIVTPRGEAALGGVRLELENLATGRRLSVTTFHDGEFYALGVPAGEYVVRIPRDVLDALGVEPPSPPVRFSLRAGSEGSFAPFVEVKLIPKSR